MAVRPEQELVDWLSEFFGRQMRAFGPGLADVELFKPPVDFCLKKPHPTNREK